MPYLLLATSAVSPSLVHTKAHFRVQQAKCPPGIRACAMDEYGELVLQAIDAVEISSFRLLA